MLSAINKVVNINARRNEDELQIGNAVVVHNPNKYKLGPRVLEGTYTVIDLKSHKLVKVQDLYG